MSQVTVVSVDKDELERIFGWLVDHFQPGTPCDECRTPREQNETPRYVTASATLGTLLYNVCLDCSKAPCPRITADAKAVFDRLISNDAALLIRALPGVVN